MTTKNAMYLTNAEAKAMNLPDTHTQIARWNKLQAEIRATAETPSRAKQIKSLMEDSGYSRRAATALVKAGF